ncbi:right-handed parallel beta-helix repeat-containing protein [Streptomyces sp. GD-15H]|uniref:right-handed parallel beta-helix repeat-containing protein n=1 Tax=Streptomyces sp. GD-15H TaxID=3129112 RepID=UPI0032438593
MIDSYGEGRATITVDGTDGIVVYDTAGVEIRNLAVRNEGAAASSGDGIKFFNDLPDGRKLDHVVVSGVEVSGFRNGISVGGTGWSGFRQVRIECSAVHHNQDAGLITYGTQFTADKPVYAHADVTVAGVEAHHNAGDPANSARNTGSGIILGSVHGGQITGCSAHDNGAFSSPEATEGPEGIWAYDSTKVVIEHNVSYRNRTGGPADGDGFGLDVNVTDSVLQYNLSYGNDGAGYLIYADRGERMNSGNVVRFNLSCQDAGKTGFYGGIHVGGYVRDVQIYQNTVLDRGGGRDVGAPALKLSQGPAGVTVRENLFVCDGKYPVQVCGD